MLKISPRNFKRKTSPTLFPDCADFVIFVKEKKIPVLMKSQFFTKNVDKFSDRSFSPLNNS